MTLDYDADAWEQAAREHAHRVALAAAWEAAGDRLEEVYDRVYPAVYARVKQQGIDAYVDDILKDQRGEGKNG